MHIKTILVLFSIGLFSAPVLAAPNSYAYGFDKGVIKIQPNRDGGGARISIQPTTSKSSISLKCGNITYKASTGTNGGSCQKNIIDNVVKCTDDDGNSAIASCKNGCTNTTGSGSCN